MNIIAPHRNNSRRVEDVRDIWKEASDLHSLSNGNDFGGEHKACYALHHSQVSIAPSNFFVLSDKATKYFPSWLIVNPRIVEKDKSTSGHKQEGCMSYPFRKAHRIFRYDRVKASYQTKKMLGWGLKDHEQWIDGVAAQIFQHEVDHANSKFIYDEK